MRALVVDDDSIVLASCRRVLEPAGWSVATAANVPEALAALEREPFTLVLADLKMPVYDGLHLLAEVRRRWPTLPVIVMSGYSTGDTEEQSRQRGALAFVPKPFTPEELLAAVGRTAGQAGGG